MPLEVFVVPEAGGWAVKRSGSDAIATFASRDEAIVFGRSIAADETAQLILVDHDGSRLIARVGIAPLEPPPPEP